MSSERGTGFTIAVRIGLKFAQESHSVVVVVVSLGAVSFFVSLT